MAIKTKAGGSEKGFKSVCLHILLQFCLTHPRTHTQTIFPALPVTEAFAPLPPLRSDVGRYKMSFWGNRDNDSPHNHQRPALVLAGAITVAPQWCLLP